MSTKIKTITVSNLKAVSNLSATFDGCTALVVGRNNGGKTSFLRGLFDRIRGTKADQPIKQGETEGFAEAILTTGEKLRWDFSQPEGKPLKEKLTYTTEKDIKTALTTELRNKFCPETFDVDKFLASTPQAQRKVLQELVGLDFTTIDLRYSEAYKERTAANTRSSDAKTLLEATAPPPKFEVVVMTELNTKKETERARLNELYTKNKLHNDAVRVAHEAASKAQQALTVAIVNSKTCLAALQKYGYTGIEVVAFINGLEKLSKPLPAIIDREQNADYVAKDGDFILIKERPDDTTLQAIDKKIVDATETNRKAAFYTAWIQLQTNKTTAAAAAIEANNKVVVIEQERLDLIKTANMPEGFTFTDDGIAYNGLAFTREQLSSSGIYIAALKLASMRMGEIRMLHFDASFLDNNSLAEIEKWASEQDLQLLIEQPSREGGEIQYELLHAAAE